MTTKFSTSEHQIGEIAEEEAFCAKAYRPIPGKNADGSWRSNLTVGFGQEGFLFAGTPGQIAVTEGLEITRKVAWEALCHFVYSIVDPLVDEHFNPQTQAEHDACASIVYNLRHDRLRKGEYTLPKLVSRADRSEAALEAITHCWLNYCLTPGAENGLYRRRLREITRFRDLPLTPAVLGIISGARVIRLDTKAPDPALARNATYAHPRGQFLATVSPDLVLEMAAAAKPIPAEPDPPKAPDPVKPIETAPMPEPSPIDPTLPPKPIEKSRTGKAINRQSRGRETASIGGLGAILVILAQQIEAVGKSLEGIGMDTMLKVGVFAFIGLAGFGAWMWWSGRNEAWLARHHPDGTPRIQDPKY